MKKYELLEDRCIEVYGLKLYRIRALRDFGDVKKGELGGYIQDENNLSHDGNAWVYINARVYGDARVYGNAEIYGDVRVYGNAWIYDNAWVYGNAEITGNAEIYGNARVYWYARVYGNARVQNGNIEYRMVVNSKFDDLKFFTFTKARDITALKVNGEWLFNIGCQNLITKEVFLKRIKNDGGVKKHPHRQDYLDILKLF